MTNLLVNYNKHLKQSSHMLLNSKHLQTSQPSRLTNQHSLYQTNIQEKNKTQWNAYSNQMRPYTHATLLSFNFANSSKSTRQQQPNGYSNTSNAPRSTPQPQSSQIFRHFTCMCEPITYWNSIGLEMRLHKQEHIHKGIWKKFGVR